MTTDTFTHVAGRGVIASGTAETIGSVEGFVLDARGRRIDSIHIDGHGKKSTLLAWPDVAAFGADAVMARSGAHPAPVDDDHQKAAVKGSVTMIGSRVLTVDGRELGAVTDVEFDTGSGQVVRVVTDHGTVDPGRLRALGSYALIIDPGSP